MSSAQHTAKILDFQDFKERRVRSEQLGDERQITPPAVFAWFPVWVMVPQFPYS